MKKHSEPSKNKATAINGNLLTIVLALKQIDCNKDRKRKYRGKEPVDDFLPLTDVFCQGCL
jgi:hypothetical protein